jgi:hypothetical protein
MAMKKKIGDVSMARPSFDEQCGTAETLQLTVVHSTDKTQWIEQSTAAFMRSCPNAQVRLVGLDDFAAIDAIEAGELRRTAAARRDGSWGQPRRSSRGITFPDDRPPMCLTSLAHDARRIGDSR